MRARETQVPQLWTEKHVEPPLTEAARSLTPPRDTLFAQTQRTMFDAYAPEHHLQNRDELTVDLLPEKRAAKVRKLLTAERFKRTRNRKQKLAHGKAESEARLADRGE